MPTPNGNFVGLVDAAGASGVSHGNSGIWRLVIHLEAWRERGGHVVRQKLRCELPVAKEDVKPLMGAINAYGIVELEAAGSEGATVKLLRIVQTVATDSDLELMARELQTPVELSSPFGRLLYDRKYGWYVGSTEWCGKKIKITLSCADPTQASSALQLASELFEAQPEWNRRVQQCAVQKLLPLKNEVWLSEGEGQLDAEDFISRMRLMSIDLTEAGKFTFWHDDGDLFGGHSIQVSGSVVDGPTRADIAG